jgi:hypothetical protein
MKSKRSTRTGYEDTSRDVEALVAELERDAPPWKKLVLARSLNEMVLKLALAGIKSRHPSADEAELKRLLADITLGPELAEQAYGKAVDRDK